MYHSRTDPKLEYLVEKYGDEFVATEYGSIQSTRFPGLYVNLRWSEEDQTYIDNYIVYLRREDLWAILAPAVQEIYDDCKVFIAPYTPSPDFDKTLRLKNYSQLLVWDETRSFLFGFIRKMIQQEKTQICSN